MYFLEAQIVKNEEYDDNDNDSSTTTETSSLSLEQTYAISATRKSLTEESVTNSNYSLTTFKSSTNVNITNDDYMTTRSYNDSSTSL